MDRRHHGAAQADDLVEAGATTRQTTATFRFTDAQAGVEFLCELDGARFSPCTTGTSYPGLALGTHTFAVRAQDAAGNVSAAATYSWTITP